MIMMNTGTSEFDQLRSDALKRREIEFLFAVIADVRLRARTGLHPVGADNGGCGKVFDD